MRNRVQQFLAENKAAYLAGEPKGAWKLQELSDETGIAVNTLSLISTGKMAPGVENGLKIARGLGRTVEEVFGSAEQAAS